MIPGLLLSNFTSNRPGSILKSSAHRTRGLPVGRFASSQSFVTFHKVTSWAMFALSRSLVRVAAQQTSRTRTLHKGVQSTPSFRVHEEEVGGVKQRFNYRSEIVDSWKLDRSHRNTMNDLNCHEKLGSDSMEEGRAPGTKSDSSQSSNPVQTSFSQKPVYERRFGAELTGEDVHLINELGKLPKEELLNRVNNLRNTVFVLDQEQEYQLTRARLMGIDTTPKPTPIKKENP
ncbi:hypothetical protein QR680_019117 [Steinernema hermaphroditum]|uniref:Uncharacterized protein n=1 Tax=Steinernema hermaphroditum TaxID=289476 RepID=A0AA39LS53_9BILA|nr:hypothetical protein QR680_019117 [Steinernema hermaphroditum]